MDALKLYESCKCNLKLYLQIWNLDDRIILDMDHSKRPQKEFEIINVNELFHSPMNKLKLMNFMQNKY